MDTDETRKEEAGDESESSRVNEAAGVFELIHAELTQVIIGSAFEVQKHLGYGFLKKVYQHALQAELIRRGVHAELEKPITVCYKGIVVGEDKADLEGERKVLVELKVAPEFDSRDEAQLPNELKATGDKVGLLPDFGRYGADPKRLVM